MNWHQVIQQIEIEKRRRYLKACEREKTLARRRGRARAAVAKAVRLKVLTHPSKLCCADCGKRAQCYDHRDYRRPLEVAAVCKGCDVKRGAGAPYRSGESAYMQAWSRRKLATAANGQGS